MQLNVSNSVEFFKPDGEVEVVLVRFNEHNLMDQETINEMYDELHEACLLASSGVKRLLIDFHRVTFLSSSAIGKMILLRKTCQEKNVELQLRNISDDVLASFQMMRLNKIFDFQD